MECEYLKKKDYTKTPQARDGTNFRRDSTDWAHQGKFIFIPFCVNYYIFLFIAELFMKQNDTPHKFVHKLFLDLTKQGAAVYIDDLMKNVPSTYDHNAAVRERQQQHPELIEICKGVYTILYYISLLLLSLYYYYRSTLTNYLNLSLILFQIINL